MRLHKKIGRTFRQGLRNTVLSRHGVAVLANTWNGLLLVEAGDFAVGRRLLQKGSYDKPEVEWLLECIGHHAGSIVIVGAHIGALLVPLSRAAEKVIGFEPDAINFDLLSKNLLLNEVHNTQLINAAVGMRRGMVALRRNSLNPGNTSISMSHDNASGQVEMTTLDSSLSGAPIDLMVMDIEGHEKHALEGGTRTIELTERLYIEFAPEQLVEQGTDPEDLLRLLSRSFPLLYLLEDRVVCTPADVGCRDIAQRMGARGFLKNLLFAKSELPGQAVQWTR